jgi:4-diphosphocytidyl-2-C-methyl-D-erythritol kinase
LFKEVFTRAPGGQGVRLLCPAKVNLYLRVLGRRPDGYHELVTVMQPLTLADELTVTLGDSGITLNCDHPELPPGEGNLVWQAVLRFQQETQGQGGVEVTLHKGIPVAAGLGGGSSDAAGALLALNHLTGAPLNGARLHSLASQLGADVPFFLQRRPAVARGIGTRITPLDLPPYWYVLLNPGLPLSTRWVYENLDLRDLSRLPDRETWDPDHPEKWVHNDLEIVTLRRFPHLKDLLGRLKGLGARAQAVSGSGPTIFGLFSSLEEGRHAAREIRRTFTGWLTVCRGLTGLPTDTFWEDHPWTV